MSRTLPSTPRNDGFYMPAEYDLHTQCWMLWPERPDNWRERAAPSQLAFSQVARLVSRSETVTIGASPAQWRQARDALPDEIRVVELDSNDAWMRDQGPLFVIDGVGRTRGVHWRFNAWGGLSGGCYRDWSKDEVIGHKILEIERIDRYAPDLILEGGSIEVDGDGTLITTEECLLNPNRNPGRSRSVIEEFLRAYLNVEAIIWLPRGLVGDDDTNGHVDNLCRFVEPGRVLLAVPTDPGDPQMQVSEEAEEILRGVTDAKGRRLEVVPVPQPRPTTITTAEARGIATSGDAVIREAGQLLPASYVNFYIANSSIIVPIFNDPADDAACDVIARAAGHRELCRVESREILLGGGNVHCITLPQPRGAR